jgi:diguanylate cyclase (GGDEF)-like protein
MRLPRIRAVPPRLPAGLLERMRTIFLLIALANTAPLVVLVALERDAGVALRVLAVVAITCVCARWVIGGRRARLGPAGDVAEAAVFATAGVALASNEDADALVIFAVLLGLLFRALYASPRRLALGALLAFASLAGWALGARALDAGSAMALSELPSQGVLVVSVAAVGYALGTTLSAYDAALGRERELQRDLVHQVSHDRLTGLPNRHEIEERLDRASARASRTRSALAVLFVDLDGFKAVNDRLGHDAGDELLCAVARRIEGCLRRSDSAGRLGGDEFGLVAEGVGRDEAVALAERVVRTVGAPVDLEAGSVKVRASVGVALAGPDESQRARLLRSADAAMYEAKRRGGGVVVFGDSAFSPALSA